MDGERPSRVLWDIGRHRSGREDDASNIPRERMVIRIKEIHPTRIFSVVYGFEVYERTIDIDEVSWRQQCIHLRYRGPDIKLGVLAREPEVKGDETQD